MHTDNLGPVDRIWSYTYFLLDSVHEVLIVFSYYRAIVIIHYRFLLILGSFPFYSFLTLNLSLSLINCCFFLILASPFFLSILTAIGSLYSFIHPDAKGRQHVPRIQFKSSDWQAKD